MQWVIENWVLLLVGGGMGAMHLFGHGHGHKSVRQNASHGPAKKSEATSPEATGQSKENTNA